MAHAVKAIMGALLPFGPSPLPVTCITLPAVIFTPLVSKITKFDFFHFSCALLYSILSAEGSYASKRSLQLPHSMAGSELAEQLTQQLFQLNHTTNHCPTLAAWLLQHHAALPQLLPLLSKSAQAVPLFDASRNYVHLMHDVLSQLLGLRNAGSMPHIVAAIETPLHRTAQACVAAAASKASTPEQLANLGATVDMWSTHGAMPTVQVSLCKAALAAANVRVAAGSDTRSAPPPQDQTRPPPQSSDAAAAKLAAVAAAATSLTRVPVGVMAQLVRSAFSGPTVLYAPIETASLPPLPSSRMEPGRLQVRLNALLSKNARDVQAERRRQARQAAKAAGLAAPSSGRSRLQGASAVSSGTAAETAVRGAAQYGSGAPAGYASSGPAGAVGGQKRQRGGAYSGLGSSATTGRIEIALPGSHSTEASELEQKLDAFRSAQSDAYHSALGSRQRHSESLRPPPQ